MKAVIISNPGGPEVLTLAERPKPQIEADDEVLIEVKAAGVNRPDIFQRKGNYPAPKGVPDDIPGLEVSGIIVAKGNQVSSLEINQEVCALIAGGGYAEYVKVKEGLCLPIPEGFSFEEAAGLPETIFTVWSNVFQRGRLAPKETLLVHGGSSGIGITAIQLAKAWNTEVIVTVGSEEKSEICSALGASKVINYKTEDFEQVLGNDRVDVILDMVGGSYFAKNINILRSDGRLVYINAMGGNKVELNINKMMQKRIIVTGSTLRSREYAFKKELAKDVLQHVWPILSTGRFKPVVQQVFPLAEAAKAHMLMESSSHIGKIILSRH